MMSIKGIMDNEDLDMNIGFLVYMMTEITKKTTENEAVQKILNDPKEHFDVVICEWMFSDLPSG